LSDYALLIQTTTWQIHIQRRFEAILKIEAATTSAEAYNPAAAVHNGAASARAALRTTATAQNLGHAGGMMRAPGSLIVVT
jgi:hypothetical protein